MHLSSFFVTSLALFVVLAASGCGGDAPATSELPAAEAPVETVEDDPATLDGEMPAYAERLLSNPYVEVSYFALPADASVALQNGENWVVYALADATVSVEQAGVDAAGAGESPAEWAEATATFYDAPVRVTNAGGTEAHLLFFERWANPLPDRREDPNEDIRFPTELMRLSEIDSDAVDVLVSNDRLGVARVSLAPGEVLPSHSAFSSVVVALSDYEAERFSGEEFGGDSPDVRIRREVGSVTWDTARNYAVENVGETPSETLVVAYYE